MGREWTPQQRAAIDLQGGNIIVSAAAGSGKTAVLVERVISRLVDPSKAVNADELLVVTFTNAAASEMKERISDELTKLIENDPSNTFLQNQKALLENAAIGTMHKFCLQLLRDHAVEIGLTPDFRVGDEKELAVMRQDVADELIEQRYALAKPEFLNMIELISSGRDDKKIFSVIMSLYSFIRARAYYNEWLDEKLAMYNADAAVEATEWGKIIKAYVVSKIEHCEVLSTECLAIIKGDDSLKEKYDDHFRKIDAQIKGIINKCKNGSWDDVVKKINDFAVGRMPAVKGIKEEILKEKRNTIKETVKKLSERQVCASQSEFADDMRVLRPIVNEMFELVKDFDEEYSRKKRERNLIDFSDIEQFAIQLLTEKNGKTVTASNLAKKISENYKYIMVDEYQDTNAAQDLIFASLSNGENLFMVGDVKQSIYRFRQAMPEIFLEKKNSFKDYTNGEFPAKIVLANNFRSRKEVTDMVNFVFSMIMSKDVGEMYYTAEEVLYPKAEYPEGEDNSAQFHIISSESEDDRSAAETEADYAADLIKNMIDSGFRVTDKETKQLRQCRAEDFAILLRSVKGKGDVYRKALEKVGIEAQTSDKESFLEQKEIAVMMSLLKAVDNPMLDIPLVSAMLSPVFNFTVDDIAAIRLEDKKLPMIVCCRNKAGKGDGKCAEFISKLDEIRLMAAVEPVNKLIEKLIRLTGYDIAVSVMENAQVRTANLRLLCEYAADYCKTANKGLGGFLRYIERIKDGGDSLDGAVVSGESGKVKIMTIHGSKGLEFPVVLLCDTSKRFNRTDLIDNVLIHPDLGVATMARDFKKRRQHNTLQAEAVKLELERAMLSEEMRMLYVALTRAKEQLIITSVQKDINKKIESLRFSLDKHGRLPSWAVRNATSYADWLIMSFVHYKNAKSKVSLSDEQKQNENSSAISLKLIGGCAPKKTDSGKKIWELTAQPDDELVEKIGEAVRWKYSEKNKTALPNKISVTELVKAGDNLEYAFSDIPDFAREQKLTAADKGTALHLYMMYANHTVGKEDAKSEIARLVNEGFITDEQGACIDERLLHKFYSSNLFERIQRSQNVHREFRFMTEATAEMLGELMPELGDEKIMLQGVVDIIFEEDGKLIVADYKTDNVKTVQELVHRYSKQVMLYGKVICDILEKPVGEILLYSFKLGETISADK
ncbi:MAG: helicase-exonuclease AddAB subunit AddA [Oscillospiraceae bacterium]|nr:helicase-exonuclease AddAB subunit AddA [Oscillospiraceae bacterium]